MIAHKRETKILELAMPNCFLSNYKKVYKKDYKKSRQRGQVFKAPD